MLKTEKIKKIVIEQQNATVQNNALCFLPGDRTPAGTTGKGLKSNIQEKLKRHGKTYKTLLKLFKPVFANPVYRKKCRKILRQYDDRSIILNLGSGPSVYLNREDIINVDIFAFDAVDLVADASRLPIEDESADLIINCAMLEHVQRPEAIVNEMFRVSKKGAQIICYLPFIVPFHAAPDDFYRWTSSGAKTLFAGFDELEVFAGAGPTSGLLWVFQEWLSILFSFGSKTLHDIIFLVLMTITSPIKLLDILMLRLPCAENIASGFCVIGRKGPSK